MVVRGGYYRSWVVMLVMGGRYVCGFKLVKVMKRVFDFVAIWRLVYGTCFEGCFLGMHVRFALGWVLVRVTLMG